MQAIDLLYRLKPNVLLCDYRASHNAYGAGFSKYSRSNRFSASNGCYITFISYGGTSLVTMWLIIGIIYQLAK